MTMEQETDEVQTFHPMTAWSQEQLRHMALDFAMRALPDRNADQLVRDAQRYLDFLTGKEAPK